MDKVRAAIIGTGFIGPAHVEAARRLGFVDMVAVAEKDQATAQSKADQLSIPEATGSYQSLLARDDIQVIHNCTPNNMHYQITKEALQAGKHVISEKPLAMNSSESRALVELAREKDLVNAIDFNYRNYSLVQEARDMVERGEVGDIYAVHGSYLQDWLYLDTDWNWRLIPELGGTSRAVADVGSHWCDLIEFISGLRIRKVFADLVTVHKIRKKPKVEVETYAGKELKPEDYEDMPIDTEDYASVLFELTNGAHGVFTVCQVAAGRKNRPYFEIDGSNCALAWDQERPNELWIGRREGPNQLLMDDPSLLSPRAKAFTHFPGGHPEAYPDGLKNLMMQVYGYIRAGKRPSQAPPPFSTFADGHHEILMVEAVLRSKETGGWVDVPEF